MSAVVNLFSCPTDRSEAAHSSEKCCPARLKSRWYSGSISLVITLILRSTARKSHTRKFLDISALLEINNYMHACVNIIFFLQPKYVLHCTVWLTHGASNRHATNSETSFLRVCIPATYYYIFLPPVHPPAMGTEYWPTSLSISDIESVWDRRCFGNC